MKPMIMPEIYKDKTKKWHDQKILRKEFRVGELVLLYNSKLKLFPKKTQVKVEWSIYSSCSYPPLMSRTLKTNSGDEFKVNGQRLKQYIGGRSNEKES